MKQTALIRQAIPDLLKRYAIKRMIDIPCGDFHWFSKCDIGDVAYLGADIVQEIIDTNKQMHEGTRRSFQCLDLTAGQLPETDLILSRDCLVHLSLHDIKKALENMLKSNSTLLLTTHFTRRRANNDIQTGDWRPLNFCEPPFYFPPPLEIINEGCTEAGGIYSDKSLGLWRLSDIRRQIEQLNILYKNSAINNVFAYWTGQQPSLIQLLIKLIQLHSEGGEAYSFNMLTKDKLLRDYSEMPQCFADLCPAHQADVARVFALTKHGGIWLDCDTLVMDSLSSLFGVLRHNEGFFITENNQKICNGVFGSLPGTRLMREWMDYITDTLNRKGPHIEWNEIGNSFLTKTFLERRDLFSNYTIFDGPQTMYPVNWDKCVKAFIEDPYWAHKHIKRSHQPLLILVNSVYKRLADLTPEQILDSEYPLNYFINKSLKALLLRD